MSLILTLLLILAKHISTDVTVYRQADTQLAETAVKLFLSFTVRLLSPYEMAV